MRGAVSAEELGVQANIDSINRRLGRTPTPTPRKFTRHIKQVSKDPSSDLYKQTNDSAVPTTYDRFRPAGSGSYAGPTTFAQAMTETFFDGAREKRLKADADKRFGAYKANSAKTDPLDSTQLINRARLNREREVDRAKAIDQRSTEENDPGWLANQIASLPFIGSGPRAPETRERDRLAYADKYDTRPLYQNEIDDAAAVKKLNEDIARYDQDQAARAALENKLNPAIQGSKGQQLLTAMGTPEKAPEQDYGQFFSDLGTSAKRLGYRALRPMAVGAQQLASYGLDKIPSLRKYVDDENERLLNASLLQATGDKTYADRDAAWAQAARTQPLESDAYLENNPFNQAFKDNEAGKKQLIQRAVQAQMDAMPEAIRSQYGGQLQPALTEAAKEFYGISGNELDMPRLRDDYSLTPFRNAAKEVGDAFTNPRRFVAGLDKNNPLKPYAQDYFSDPQNALAEALEDNPELREELAAKFPDSTPEEIIKALRENSNLLSDTGNVLPPDTYPVKTFNESMGAFKNYAQVNPTKARQIIKQINPRIVQIINSLKNAKSNEELQAIMNKLPPEVAEQAMQQYESVNQFFAN